MIVATRGSDEFNKAWDRRDNRNLHNNNSRSLVRHSTHLLRGKQTVDLARIHASGTGTRGNGSPWRINQRPMAITSVAVYRLFDVAPYSNAIHKGGVSGHGRKLTRLSAEGFSSLL